MITRPSGRRLLRGLFAEVCWLSGVGVWDGAVMSCVVVCCGAWCCVCALPGLRVARAPCPSALWCRRGDTLALRRARMAPWRLLLVHGCGLSARQWAVCLRGGSGSPPCVSPPLALPSLFAALPYVPSLHCARSDWVGLGWLGWLAVHCWCCLTWWFFPAGRHGPGLSWGWVVLRYARLVRRAVREVF